MRLFLTFLLLPTLAFSHLIEDLQFSWHDSKLPFPISDVTANTFDGDKAVIILTGGCDSANGNERVNFGGDDLFACLSTSNRTLQFDGNSFTELAPMPHARQRHAAAVVNGELYLIGGRDSNDELVTAIDSYNPQTNQWTTRGYLPDDLATSDLTAWAWDDFLYVTGGFQADYTAVGTTYRFDMSNDPFQNMDVTMLATSPHPRGDMHAVVHDGYAFLAGGLTHTSLWCEGLTTTERYHMERDEWETIAPLPTGRADMAVAELGGKIVALGGETKPEGCQQVQDPAYGSFPADHVEVLLHPSGPAEWIPFETFPDQRFRFAAAVLGDTLYTFGGQLPFDFTCDCFPTSDNVGVAVEVLEEDDHNKLNPGAIVAIVLGVILAASILVFVVRSLVRRQNVQEVQKEAAKVTNHEHSEEDLA
mmetsp:Transcript_20466/g.38288  ORF Transcript_20466/g.38288 Transcript_20466/m.38288 type:complete len:419 (+) Transcript_20466:171-1427(+)